MPRAGDRVREDLNRRLLRARDSIDRLYAQPLDVAELAAISHMSKAYFIRSFRSAFGEPPHRYLQRRRIERAMALLTHSERSITETCFEVGFSSMGTFSRTFHDIVNMSPTEFRRSVVAHPTVPSCFAMAWTRPSSFGEAESVRQP